MKIKFDCWKWFVVCLFGVLFLSMMNSCKTTKYVPVTMTEYRDRYIHQTDSFVKTDSVWVHDSVSVVVRGDTIFNDRWHYKFKDRIVYQSKTDTVRVRDSVPYKVEVPVEKVVYKEKKVGFFQCVSETIGNIAIGFILFFAISFVLKYILGGKRRCENE